MLIKVIGLLFIMGSALAAIILSIIFTYYILDDEDKEKEKANESN